MSVDDIDGQLDGLPVGSADDVFSEVLAALDAQCAGDFSVRLRKVPS